MNSNRQFTDTVSADAISAGYIYQLYYFILRLLQMKSDESVGFEVCEDVHIELDNSNQILVQVKHTVQDSADGTPVNLTTMDIDLWKTLHNWSKIITDENSGRGTARKQEEFIDKTDFLLTSNKKSNENNDFICLLSKYKYGDVTFAEVQSVISSIKNRTKNKQIIPYIEEVLSLSDNVLSEFLYKIGFDLGQDDIIGECKQAMRVKLIPENKIEETWQYFSSAVLENCFNLIRNRKQVVISFDEFFKNYQRFFDKARSGKLAFCRHTDSLPPEALDEQIFIKQLIDIGDIPASNFEEMLKFTMQKLRLEDNLLRFVTDGVLTSREVKDFDEDAIVRWENIFRRVYRQIASSKDELKQRALAVLDEIRQTQLAIDFQELEIALSNGEYYHLSDVLRIGWRKDWKEFYQSGGNDDSSI